MTDEVTEPVEPVAEAEPAELDEVQTPGGDIEQEPDAADTTAEQGKSRAKKRIRQLSQRARNAEQRAEALESRLAELEKIVKQPAKRPARDDYATDEDWENALVEHGKTQVRPETPRTPPQLTAEQQAILTDFESKLDEISEDAADVVLYGDEWSCSPDMTDFIRVSEKGPLIAYHLAQNPRDADRISKLSPIIALRELEKLEAKLEPPKKSGTRQAPPPPPADTTRPGGSSGVVDPDKMSPEQWLKLRRQGKI